ncbi:MAG: hypothetical protein AAGF11_14895 [Myxococcota bacterium]
MTKITDPPAPTMATIEPLAHYLLPIQRLIELFESGRLDRVQSIEVEPEYGRVARILYKDGHVRIIHDHGFGVNRADAAYVARDKGLTKHFLERLGYRTPTGQIFCSRRWQQRVGPNLARSGSTGAPGVDQIIPYIHRTLTYPCIIKPSDGSLGEGVFKCFDDTETRAAIESHAQEGYRFTLVEQFVTLPLYRVNVWKRELMYCGRRVPLQLRGDGRSSIEHLLTQHLDALRLRRPGVSLQPDDPRLDWALRRRGLDSSSIPKDGESVVFDECMTFPLGGDIVDLTTQVHPYWRDLCMNLTRDMGLLLAGIDLFCADITEDEADYRVLEVNAAPRMANYATTGSEADRRTHALFLRLLNGEALDEPRG